MERKITNIKERILYFTDFKGFSKEKFFEDLQITYGNFKGKAKNQALGSDVIERIITKYPEINAEWLLIGKEPMLKSEQNLPVATYTESLNEGIPLIPLDAMAGVGSGEISVLELDCERYVIPMFKGADYLIPVKGSSMYPKYNSGDVVACKKLSLQDIFFQWNKVYVLDTEQGALIKRVCKGSDNEHITLVSDNPKYEPFELHKSQIYAVALVVGVVRLE
ncbi:S24 family peptidase [Capnocytophaga canis]|uniref:S24 family peptidase n=1 Tax=Capnocytophaga canis TaxID=1848903 RepID=UPI001562B4FC|nr:helix-turn-helix transcriptional regulator [Capnocytophaga canis]